MRDLIKIGGSTYKQIRYQNIQVCAIEFNKRYIQGSKRATLFDRVTQF